MPPARSFFLFTRSGCLLPLGIILNLFFGRIFFRTVDWFAIELILILLFTLNAFFLTRKIFSSFNRRENVIDVEGKVIDDNVHKIEKRNGTIDG